MASTTAFRKQAKKLGLPCEYCKTDLKYDLEFQNDPQFATVDHIIPKSKKGLSTKDNFNICCKRCNSKKGSKSINSFIKSLGLNYEIKNVGKKQESTKKKKVGKNCSKCPIRIRECRLSLWRNEKVCFHCLEKTLYKEIETDKMILLLNNLI